MHFKCRGGGANADTNHPGLTWITASRMCDAGWKMHQASKQSLNE